MAEIDMTKAREIYDSIVANLEAKDWKFDRDDEQMTIKSGVRGEDLPLEFVLHVHAKNELVQFLSVLPFTFAEDKRVDGAVATCVVNYRLLDGCFDFDISDGKMLFRLNCSYRGNDFSSEQLMYMIMVASKTIDDYNDKFFMMAKDMITLPQFIDKVNG